MTDIPEERREFVQWLEEQIERTGSMRTAARRAGISHATLSRALQGDPVTLTTLEGISKWTQVDLIRLLRLYGAQLPEDQHIEAALARVLDQNPELRGVLEAAMEVLDEDELTQVIEFIQFQVERKKRHSA
jgi:transcriptional regulator with XRE-family HTH domain